jgi:FixJ family two-component response regulator
MMPTMHGDEFVRRMQDVAPEVPCIILTGNATREHVVQLMKQPNVARILTKPWDRARLVDAINEAVGRGEAALGAGRP